MPIYEYRCANGHTFELFQRMSDPAPEACETCGASVQKVLTAPAIHYKGSGFYSTDYGRGGKKGAKDGKSEGSSSSSSEGGSSSSSSSSSDGGSSSSGGEKSSAPAKSAAD